MEKRRNDNMARTTKVEVRNAFQRLCEICNRKILDYAIWPEDKQIGSWRLDSAPGYSGYIVEEINNDGLGVSRPLGDLRMSPKEFCNFVYRTSRVMDCIKRR